MNRFGPEEEEAVLEVIRSGQLSPFYRNFRGGGKVQEFEEAFRKFVGSKHAIAVSNGTAALHTAVLAAAGTVGTPGSKNHFATTPASFIATATSIRMAGKWLHFHDVDPATYNLLPATFFSNDAIMPVDLLGNPCEIDEIRRQNPNHLIIQDAAQALGSYYRGRHCGAGGWADAAAFSFQETKSMTTGGEGGMIVTDNEEIAEKCRNIRNHGIQYADSTELCYNYRMTEIQAAFGLVQLKKLPGILELQTENAKYIMGHLPNGLHPPTITFGGTSNWYIIGCTYDEKEAGMPRNEFIDKLTKLGVNRGVPGGTVSPGYQLLIYDRPFFKPLKNDHCPNAESLKAKWLWLDIHRFTELENVKRDVEIMHEVLR